MLTQEENELFTRVGPGTPVGRLMRWYWHPIAAATQLDEDPVRPVRLLGESWSCSATGRAAWGWSRACVPIAG